MLLWNCKAWLRSQAFNMGNDRSLEGICLTGCGFSVCTWEAEIASDRIREFNRGFVDRSLSVRS